MKRNSGNNLSVYVIDRVDNYEIEEEVNERAWAVNRDRDKDEGMDEGAEGWRKLMSGLSLRLC